MFLEQFPASVDVLVLGETWLKEERKHFATVNRYRSFLSCRPDSSSGGLAVLVKESLIVTEIENLHVDGFHYIHLRLQPGGVPIDVHAVYRPPSQNAQFFLNKLESVLASLKPNSQFLMLGDVNIPINRTGCPVVESYVDLLRCYGCTVSNTYVTRPASCNILDHVVCSDSIVEQTLNETVPFDISDHNLVLTTINMKKHVEHRKLEKVIVQHERINEAFRAEFNNLEAINPTEKLEKLSTLYRKLKERFSITVSAEAKIKGFCPWMSLDVWKIMRIKEKAIARCKKHPTNDEFKFALIEVSKKLNRAKAEAKKNYYNKLFQKSNQKQIWKNLNNLIRSSDSQKETIKIELNGVVTEEGKTVSNAFNQYFCNIGTQLVATIPRNINSNEQRCDRSSNSIYVRPATEEEVILKISKLDSSKSPGPDGIPAQFVKANHTILAPLIRNIFNDCIQNGEFPEFLKTARVLPIYKAGKRTDCSNYRPISILSVFSKLLEQLLADRVSQFLKQHKLLYSYQYGFREGSSTLTAATELVDAIHSALDNRKFMGVLFLDLKKAFDTIDHAILLRKLDTLGIRGNANSLFASYLAGRKQYVQINQSSSDLGNLPVGVPQGSNLGPLLFILYVNDLHKLHLHGKPRLFADDTSLSYEHSDVGTIISQMSMDLEQLKAYFDTNLLSLNLDKTKYIIFKSNNRLPTQHDQLQVNTTVIQQVKTFKYLGLKFDEHMRWDAHIDCLRKDLSAIHSILWKISSFIPTMQLICLYHAFVQAKLQYMISIWGAARKKDIKALQTMQNRCLKAVYKRPRLFSTLELFQEASQSILPIAALRELQGVIQIHNKLHNPLFHYNQQIQQLNHRFPTRSRGNLTHRRANTEKMKRSPEYFSKMKYNHLPPYLKLVTNKASFKRQVKAYLKANLTNYIA